MSHTAMRIRAAIDKQQKTQKEIAQQLRISETYLSDILTGRRSVSAFVAVRLERVLGMDANKIMIDQSLEALRVARTEYSRAMVREEPR